MTVADVPQGAEIMKPQEQLNHIEARIHAHMQIAADGLLDVGRCLLEAKEAGLVPHGEWEAWVQQHTGMHVRQAQRLMHAAKNTPKGSAIARLPFSKLQAVLSLPEGEREEMAEQAQADDMTLRQLQEEVRRRKAAEGRLKEVEGNLRSHTATDAQERKRLREEITRLEAALNSQPADDTAPPSVDQGEIARLRQELADMEAYTERQAEERQKAQQALLQLQAQVARGETHNDQDGSLSLETFADATRAFIGTVAMLPHMGHQLARMDGDTRATFRSYIDMVGQWHEQALQSMQAEYVEGAFDCE
ncbi:DUF3102 domain-containing protein [Eubacteriales bacterium OttesenSCG-928-A19]|nr:DUF3102 domain-containing protein [Eubacteriales bacterium OttesenSCG-928-A19]